jgi:hypothetical protein
VARGVSLLTWRREISPSRIPIVRFATCAWLSSLYGGLQVIVALSSRSRDHIPYRSSKLTHILKDSIGGNCKTMMIANVWGEEAQLDETLSTCKFAQRMMRVANDPNVNLRQVWKAG